MTEIVVWNNEVNLSEIRQVFGKGLSDAEWQTFMSIGKATGLNPFLKEIWCIKYSNNDAAQIFISRDGYRKSAQRQADYDYHNADAVYENDTFLVKNGEIEHSYGIKDRGKLVGAYCVIKRKTASKSQFCYVEAKEYMKNSAIWREKSATMLKKVAEAQCLRLVFQNIYAGTYSEYEAWKREQIIEILKCATDQVKQIELKKENQKDTFDAEEVLENQDEKNKSKIYDLVDKSKTYEELKNIWKEHEHLILNLTTEQKAPILKKFSSKKRELNEQKQNSD